MNGAIAFLMANPIVAVIVAIIAAITLLIAIIQDFITFYKAVKVSSVTYSKNAASM